MIGDNSAAPFQDPALTKAYREGRQWTQTGRGVCPYDSETVPWFAFMYGADEAEEECIAMNTAI